ncbi:MAG: hypothetical protein ACYCO3_07875 [Mycobacteriales bacterium]
MTIHAPDQLVITFTAKGERALDVLAITLVKQTELTPAGITDLPERLVTTPVDVVLADALLATAAALDRDDQLTLPLEAKRVKS